MEVEGFLRNVAFPLLRFGTYTAHLLLFGLAVVLLLVLRPAFRSLDEATWSGGRRHLAARISDIVRACLMAGTMCTFLILLLQTGLVSEFGGGEVDSESFRAVLDSTFGLWTALRLPLLAALAVLLLRHVSKTALEDGVRGAAPSWWVAWVGLGLALLATSSIAGHAYAGRPQGLSLANDLVHLAAGGIWFAGIVVLAGLLPVATRGRSPLERLQLLSLCVSSFATVALVSMAVLVVTGTLNSFLHLKGLSDLWETSYGQTLLFKLGLFTFVLGLGALSHFVLRVQLADAVAAGTTTTASDRFKSSIAAEMALGFGIVAATGLLTHLAP